MSWKIKKRIKTRVGLFFQIRLALFFMFGRVFYQTFTGFSVDLVRFFCLTRSFSFNYRAIMVGESFKGAPYEDEMFN